MSEIPPISPEQAARIWAILDRYLPPQPVQGKAAIHPQVSGTPSRPASAVIGQTPAAAPSPGAAAEAGARP